MRLIRITIALVIFLAQAAHAGWVLDNDDSAISFTSTKANTAAEVHGFGTLEGSVDDAGNVTVTIDLETVDTAIEIRDERMRELLFETSKYPVAQVTLPVDIKAVEALEPGESMQLSATATVALHGTTAEVAIDSKVVRLTKDRILVASEKPAIINAGQVDLGEGVEKLREIAGLPSISPAVPVTFILAFDAE